MSDTAEIASHLEKAIEKWHEPIGLLSAWLAAWLVAGWIGDGWIAKVAIGLSLGLIASGAWIWGRRLPKSASNRVGIAIAISAGNPNEQRFADDFTEELRQLLSRSRAGPSFQIVVAPKRVLNDARLPDAAASIALRQKMRCAFILAGRVRVRKLDGKDHLVLDLVGAVAHRPISEEVQSTFTREFTELLPNRIALPSDQDLLAFTLTGSWMTAVAQYIIGIAAGLSGDLDYARALYESARQTIVASAVESPASTKILARIPTRLAELSEARANAALELWKIHRTREMAEQFKAQLNSIAPEILSGPRYMHLRAISAFLVDRDVDGALRILESRRGAEDPMYYWNSGFLHAYGGNLKKAAQLYRSGAVLELPPEIPAQLEEFMLSVLAEEPDKVQIHYCLGVLNRDVKGDNVRARDEFRSFLEKTPKGQFESDKVVVQKWLDELRGRP